MQAPSSLSSLILCLVQPPTSLVLPMSCNNTEGKKRGVGSNHGVGWHHLSVWIWPLWLAAIVPLFFLLVVVPLVARFLNVKRNSDSR